MRLLLNTPKKLKSADEIFAKHFLRLQVYDVVGVFAEITGIFSKHNVSFEKILQMPIREKGLAEIVLVTHHACLKDYEDVLVKLRDLQAINEVKSSYRVEGSNKR